MYLKILIGLVTLGVSSVSAKAKGKPQGYSRVPVSFYPVTGIGLPANYIPQQFVGLQQALPYNFGFLIGNDGGFSSRNVIRNPVLVNSQTRSGANYYQQQIPVPVAFASGLSLSNSVQPGQFIGRLWPKHLVNPGSTPTPPVSEQSNYFAASSTPSPQSYQSTQNFAKAPLNSLNSNSQYSVSSSSPVQPQSQSVPVNFDARNSFQQDILRYNIPQTAQNYQVNYNQQPRAFSISQNQQNIVSSTPYPDNYQQTASPFDFQNQQVGASQAPYLSNNYKQQPTPPSPYAVNIEQSSPSQAPNQQPIVSPFIQNYQQLIASSSPYLVNYQFPSFSPYVSQQPISAAYIGLYPQAGVFNSLFQQSSPFANGDYNPLAAAIPKETYQSSSSPLGVQYQQPTQNDQTTTVAPVEKYQLNIPASVASSHNQIQSEPTKPSDFASSDASSNGAEQITIVSTSSPKPQNIEVTEKPVTPTPVTLRPEIIKTEYSGDVSPQYNHITSSPASIRLLYGALVGQPAYVPLNNFIGYSPSTDVSRVNFDGLGAKYSF